MLEFLILYFPLLPFWMYFLIELFTYIRKFQFEKKFNSDESKTVNILDPDPILSLGQIEHIFLDKTGTITQKDFKVKDIYFDSKLYHFHSKNFMKLIEKYQNQLQKKNAFSLKKFSDFPLQINPTYPALPKKDCLSPEFLDIPKKESQSPSLSDIQKKESSISKKDLSPPPDYNDKNGQNRKESALPDFIEVPTYTIERYSPQKNDAKNLNIPNKLPPSLPLKHFPLEKTRQFVYFLKNNIISGDAMEDEETAIKNTENSAAVKFNLKPATKKLQKASEDNIFYDGINTNKKSSPMKISFDLSFEKSHHFLNSSNSSLRSLLLNENNRIKKFSPCTADDFLNDLLKNSDYLDPLFEAFTICHSAKISNNNEFLSVRSEEEVKKYHLMKKFLIKKFL